MLSLSFVLRQLKTNLRLTESETIKVLEFKNDLEFEHRLRNLKLASYLTQTRNSKSMAAHVREERRRIRQLNNVRRPRLFRDRTNPLEELPAEAAFERFRFSPATIMFLMTIVGEAASQTMRNCPLPPLIRLLVCLRYLASGTFHMREDLVHWTTCKAPPFVELVLNEIGDQSDAAHGIEGRLN